MATNVVLELQALAIYNDMMSPASLRQDWQPLREGDLEFLTAVASTVNVPVGTLRIKKTTTTNDSVVEIIELPVDLP